MTITLLDAPAAPAAAPAAYIPHVDPACPACGATGTANVGVLEDLNGDAYTDCCGANPIAFTCRIYLVSVYLSAAEEWPDACPHCGTCPA
ncbi:hypothetical protein GCM10027187_40430 [Streptosporangium sandarakinum]|uniref:Uncharacterized protein n=1 Tax=Streptosporangium sandarakinum TaxID=1260955 RepID=A0A852V920_9ACTN|nr:hypothetical protein [Streptosporangium sandarakinum]NYF44626.1 hypothetical protein [Streptosporangium sandarakinum]